MTVAAFHANLVRRNAADIGPGGGCFPGATGVAPVPSSHPLRNDRAAVGADLPMDLDPVRRQYELGARTLREPRWADAGLDVTGPRLR